MIGIRFRINLGSILLTFAPAAAASRASWTLILRLWATSSVDVICPTATRTILRAGGRQRPSTDLGAGMFKFRNPDRQALDIIVSKDTCVWIDKIQRTDNKFQDQSQSTNEVENKSESRKV